jgi:Ni,Fe-hydrogenase III small subunit
MALGDSVVDAGLVVGSVTNQRREWTGDLVEQGPNLRAIIDIAAG